MPLSLLISALLLRSSEGFTEYVKAQANAQGRVFAMSVPIGAVAPGPSETPEVYSERVAHRLLPFDSGAGLMRPDRPLLIASQDATMAHDLKAWPILELIASPLGQADASGLAETTRGGYEFPLTSLDRGRADALVDRFQATGMFKGGIPADARVGFSGGVQILLKERGGDTVGVWDSGGTEGYDPEPYLRKLRFADPDPVPAALAEKLRGSKVDLVPTNATLAEWIARLGREKVDLRVDRRAGHWRVAMAAPTPRASAVEVLRAIARTQRLYWRPVGDVWMLAASPSEPRTFSIELARARALENLIPLMGGLARAGVVSEDAFALLVGGMAGETTVGEHDSNDIVRLRRLISRGKPFSDDGGRLAALLRDPSRVAASRLEVSYSMNVTLRFGANRLGIGMVLP